jgi:HK97 family phage major capsid protein
VKAKIEELRRKRAGLVEQMRGVLEVAENEDRELTGEERYQRLERSWADELGETRERAAAPPGLEVPAEQLPDGVRGVAAGLQEWRKANLERLPQDDPEYRDAFYKMLSVRSLSVLEQAELRVLSKATAAAGANLVPQEFERQLIDSLRWLGSLRSLATVITTSDGSEILVPTVTSHGTAAWIGENASYTESDEAFGNVSLKAYKAGTMIRVSEELLADSAFDLDAYMRREFGTRIGILEETAYVVGDGTGKPTGIVGQATAGVTAASTTALTYDELVDLMFSVPVQYRGRASFLVSDTFVRTILKLKDNDGRPLWGPGLNAGQPDTIMGRPVYPHPDMAAPAAAAVPALFGDFSYYWIRDVNGVAFQRLNELYAANGQVGFRAYHRTDGKLTNTAAVKKLTMAAA